MADQSSARKREVSLRALGRLAAATGYVVQPYLVWPELMPRMLGVLREGRHSPWSLRREVLRTFGILGALDPLRLEVGCGAYLPVLP